MTIITTRELPNGETSLMRSTRAPIVTMTIHTYGDDEGDSNLQFDVGGANFSIWLSKAGLREHIAACQAALDQLDGHDTPTPQVAAAAFEPPANDDEAGEDPADN